MLKEAIVIAIVIAEKPSQMIRLEAYTLSNAGDEVSGLLITTKTTGWKPVPKQSIIRNLL